MIGMMLFALVCGSLNSIFFCVMTMICYSPGWPRVIATAAYMIILIVCTAVFYSQTAFYLSLVILMFMLMIINHEYFVWGDNPLE